MGIFNCAFRRCAYFFPSTTGAFYVFCAPMKLALLAFTTLVFAGCTSTNTIYNHRSDFSPNGSKGPWTEAYRDSYNHQYAEDHGTKRPLFRRTID